jgi:LysR family hydrogen peroxide-inducible transcriptional activator
VHDDDVEAELLFEEDLIVVAPTSHPLAELDRVTITDLAEHELLLEPKGTAFRDDIDAQVLRAGLVLRPRAEVDGMRLLASLAFEGFGAAILPASAAPRVATGNFKVVGVDGMTGRTVGIVRRRRGLPSAPARAIDEVLRRVVADEASAQPGIHTTVRDGA